MLNKKALTLIEIVVALVILAITIAGLVNLYISGNRWIAHSRSWVAGGELGKHFLDPLQMDVRQDQWDPPNNCLSQDGMNRIGCNTNPWADPSSGITYTPQYDIGPVNATQLRRVTVTISWNENRPQ
jgi:prepilin-type N-terminal cleavage/methylation domain-containing protein